MMRTFILLFCTTLFGLTAKGGFSQNDKIVIDADKVISVDAVFKMIKAQTDYSFVYHEGLFKDFPKVPLKKGTIRLNKLLSQSFSTSAVNVIFTLNNTILIKDISDAVISQQRRVSGTVTDPSGLPLPGVTVLIKGTTRGTATDLDGFYSIKVPDPAHVLVFSSLGFEPQEVIVGSQTTINLSLKERISSLDAVTIEAGYYKTSQRVATGGIGSIDAKAIEKQPVNNPLSAMQGHIAGVNISQNSGLPGGNYRIQIRGRNFIDEEGGYDFGTANNPLYIVDGVPYDSGSLEAVQTTSGGVILGGVSPLNTINPADIKSIEVLKDADATAIYGSRGANGVVLITTKKGRVGKTRVKLTVSTSLSEASGFINLMNTEQYLEVRREAFANSGTVTNNATDLYLWDQQRYTDWQEVLIGNTAYRNNVQLSFSGGSEQTQFLLSSGYLSETTVFPGDSKYEKASLLFNMNHQSKNERFKLNFSGTYGSDTNNLPGNDLTRQARILPPNAPALYDDQGNINYWGDFGSSIRNPLAFLETDYRAVTRNLIANTMLSYRLAPALELKTSLGYTDYRLDSYWAQPHTQYSPNIFVDYTSKNSKLNTNTGTRKSWIIEPQINWHYEWDAASIKLLVGATFQQNKEQQLTLRGEGFSSNALILNLASADDVSIFNVSASEYKYHSFFGRFNFNWQDRYIVNLTGRRDGSSRFGPGKQFGYFGALGAAWLFSEEPMLDESEVLSFGKLRASYGITGSDNVGNYKFLETYGTAFGSYNGSGLEPTGLFNPDYAWGETKKLEAALELGFFKDHIFISTAWYRNRSSNQLVNVPLPATVGFSGINANWDALVENTGFEMELRTVNIKRDHFTWSTTFNVSMNRNKLVSFPGIAGSTFNDLRIGRPLGVQGLYHFIGVDPDTGIYQYEDYNNDGLIDRDDNDEFFVDFTPKYFGGLGNTIQYKGLQLDVFFQFKKQKVKKYEASVNRPAAIIGNVPVAFLDRWQQPGDQAPYQGFFTTDNRAANEAEDLYFFSTAAITDASFIRLRNVSLSYRVPKTVTKAKNLDINIYLQGQNLFVISPYKGTDPEALSSRTLPPLRQFTLGLNVSF
ncbi:SusC/RagA family TonB-linked outer membrane protein [Flavivirga aquimarina]|uniref:SusC/RagA family TonB-linked outer membrane protein n=1 Tax=Flavivirga aquimarina TaxID=2027862 RepID=A0ABT8W8F0_9FLAO|nr:SusC/RagA family TonB-linked outer membrane protein [Flavivirga aquimarina]MDO5969404.1 SusC/RagA family TonB-linked outer membrane protein [Flavivirga aquimarina]